MVVGYMCAVHGWRNDCGVDESGERTCPECGDAVTGVTGRARDMYRSPPEDKRGQAGVIAWDVYGHGEYNQVVASDLRRAGEKAADSRPNPQQVRKIRPTERRYRA